MRVIGAAQRPDQPAMNGTHEDFGTSFASAIARVLDGFDTATWLTGGQQARYRVAVAGRVRRDLIIIAHLFACLGNLVAPVRRLSMAPSRLAPDVDAAVLSPRKGGAHVASCPTPRAR